MNSTRMKISMGMFLAAAYIFINNAHAGLVNVSSIEIVNIIGEHTQIAEVVALDMYGNDVALLSAGASATAPTQWSDITSPQNTIDGITDGNYFAGQIYHDTVAGIGSVLTIALASPTELFSIDIFGRSECCVQRDFFNVSFLDVEGNVLFASDFDARFSNNIALALPNTNVPEPAGVALLISGFAGLFLRRIRRRNTL